MRDGAEIEELCEAHQPLALFVSSPMNEATSHLVTRCWTVGSPGAELGAVTAVRLGPGLVSASAVLLDPAGAQALADLVRRAGARRMSGAADHVGPIVEVIPGSSALPLEIVGIARPDLPGNRRADPLRQDWRDHVRVARAGDVTALVGLYRQFPLEFLGPSQLQPALEALVREHRVLVLEADGAIVGAQRVEARSKRWNLWSGLTVLPEHRGRGLSRWIERCTREMGEVQGRGNVGVVAPTNPSSYEVSTLVSHPWLEVRLPVVPSLPARGRRWARRQVRTRLRPSSPEAPR